MRKVLLGLLAVIGLNGCGGPDADEVLADCHDFCDRARDCGFQVSSDCDERCQPSVDTTFEAGCDDEIAAYYECFLGTSCEDQDDDTCSDVIEDLEDCAERAGSYVDD